MEYEIFEEMKAEELMSLNGGSLTVAAAISLAITVASVCAKVGGTGAIVIGAAIFISDWADDN